MTVGHILNQIKCAVKDCVNNDEDGFCDRGQVEVGKTGQCLNYQWRRLKG